MIKSHRSKSWRADPEADRLSGTAGPRGPISKKVQACCTPQVATSTRRFCERPGSACGASITPKSVSEVCDKQRAYLRKGRRERGAAPRRKRAPNSTLDNMLTGACGEPDVSEQSAVFVVHAFGVRTAEPCMKADLAAVEPERRPATKPATQKTQS